MAIVSESMSAVDRGARDRSGVTTLGRRHSARLKWSVAALLLLGAVVFGRRVDRPINGNTIEDWRETDMGGIARNYSREGMHLLYPRIDWRGDGPGYVESEFPIYPYLIAIGYRTVGFHEQIGRVISWALTLGTLCLILALIIHILPPDMVLPGTIAAGLFFIADPLTNRIAATIQPEPLMLMAYVGAVYAYVRWLDDDRWWWYGWALALTALAVLAKLPALHLGIVFVALTVWRQGWSAFTRLRLWVLAVAAVVPSVLWYVHARGFWDTYGNSLGLSNHHHIIGLAAFTHLGYLLRILSIEIKYAWTPPGFLTVLLALAIGAWSIAYGYGLLWYAAILFYYLVIAGTAAEKWGEYYHIVSVPPIALMFGAAAATLWVERGVLASRSRQLAAGLAVLAMAAWLVGEHLWERAAIGVGLLAAATVGGMPRLWGGVPRTWSRAAGLGVWAGCAAGTIVFAARQTASESHPTLYVTLYTAARQFAPLIPPHVLIAVSSDQCTPRDESAGNMPWMLYWTDHHGFDLCADSQTVGGLQHLAARGARYFIEDRRVAARVNGFDSTLRTHYRVMSEAPAAVLFDLGAADSTTRRAEITHASP